MSAHQDSRVEALITAGLGKIVEAAAGAIGDQVTGIELGPLMYGLREYAVKAARGPLL